MTESVTDKTQKEVKAMDYINEKNIIEVQEVTVNTTEKAYEDAYEKLKHNKGVS